MTAELWAVPCPNCQASAGQPCTQPTSLGRRAVSWVHDARAEAAEHGPAPASAATVTLARVLLATLTENGASEAAVACDCGEELALSEETSIESVVDILQHIAFGHPTRHSLIVRRDAVLLNDWHLGLAMGLPARSDAEQDWRDSRA